MEQLAKYGKIAFITTPNFRAESSSTLEDFIYSQLYKFCLPFKVMTTGRTGMAIKDIINSDLSNDTRHKIQTSMGINYLADNDLGRWKNTINNSLEVTMEGFQGMIHVSYELVEGRLDGVIHLTDWQDKSAKPDSAVLSREANVHNVPIAINIDTALDCIKNWNIRIASSGQAFIYRHSPTNPPLAEITEGHKVLAIVAHDNMKLETCRFAIEHARHIFQNYDYILATGTTGGWLKRFMEAMGRSKAEVARIRSCNSGPKGGDIQIAYAVVMGLCQKIIFLQDPSVSHPHDSDIRLFEQAVAKGVNVKLATNVESARLLIGA